MKKLFIILISLLAITWLNQDKANAQQINVGIYPPILQIDANPPASVNSEIAIENKSDQTATYTIYLVPFTSSSDNNGTPTYDESLKPVYKSIFDKIQILDSDRVVSQVTLAPKQKKALIMHIGIPEGEKAYDYYFSVLFINETDIKEANNSFSGARGGIGTNVLLSIGPKGNPEGRISEFSTKRFTTGGPVEFEVEVENTGQSYFSPVGSILVKNMFGQTIGQIEAVPVNILSKSKRLIPSEKNSDIENPRMIWNEKFLLGIYSAEVKFKLSEQGPIISKKTTFFAFPVEGIFGILIGIILLFLIIRRVRQKQLQDGY